MEINLKVAEKCVALKRSAAAINSLLTLYEEKLKEEFESDFIDEIIIDSKNTYLHYEALCSNFRNSFNSD